MVRCTLVNGIKGSAKGNRDCGRLAQRACHSVSLATLLCLLCDRNSWGPGIAGLVLGRKFDEFGDVRKSYKREYTHRAQIKKYKTRMKSQISKKEEERPSPFLVDPKTLESSFTPMDQVTHSTLGTLEKESPLCRDLAEIAKRVKRGSFDDVTLSSPSDTPLHFSRNLSLLVNRETFINNTGIMLPSYLNSSLDSHKSDPHTITTEEARELEQEMEISDSDRLNDTNMVFHGPDHKDCRSLKLKLFYDKIFRDLDFRPFTIKFPLNIFFEGIKITPGMEINSLESNYKPEVRYRGEDRLYFFLMVDMDDPIPEDPFNRESVLWARYNIPGECFWMGKDVVPWTGHVNAMGKHRILAFLYEQKQSMYIPAFPMQQVKQKDLTYWLDLNPVSVAYYKNEGTELSERDLGMHIKDGPLSSTDSNSYIDKLKKTSKEVIKNLTRYHIRADAAARGLLPPV